MHYLGVDLSFAKSGVAVLSVKNGKPKIEHLRLAKPNPKDSDGENRETYERIDEMVTEIKYIANKYNVQEIAKEESLVGRASTATNVLKTHGVLEDTFKHRFKIEGIHSSTIKAWARRVTGIDKVTKENKKTIVAEAVEKYFGEKIEGLWTPRGALIDDIADAIAVMIIWLEKNDIIEK